MHWLLKILCWILAEIEIMRIHAINTFSYCTVAKACFCLNLLRTEVSSLKEVWFFFEIFLNQNMFPKGVILHRNSIENVNMGGGSFMIRLIKVKSSHCEFLCVSLFWWSTPPRRHEGGSKKEKFYFSILNFTM